MRIITLEEHFATALFLDGPGQDLKKAALKFEGRAMKLIEPLCDIGDKRLAAMDAAGIDFQMLSLTSPGTEQLDAAEAVALACDANDAVAEAVKKHPKRFGGFAALPTMMPDKAAAELEQRVRSGAFKGAVINGHVRGRYLDDKFFWPILECAEALNAPIHIHPTKPPQPVFDAYYGGFSPVVSDVFGSPGWGWHIETTVHVIRLILGGAFDRFSETATRDRPSRRGLDVAVSAARQYDAGNDQAAAADHRVFARERALHGVRFQFPDDISQFAARGRHAADHVLRRSSISIDDIGPRVLGAPAGPGRRSRAHRTRQRRKAVRGVSRVVG